MHEMALSPDQAAGRFCWVDLAATDAGQAQTFYGELFGWLPCQDEANGGAFTRLRLGDREIGSIYQLQPAHLDRGVPSHWTPYVHVTNVDAAVRRTETLGGQVLIRPLAIAGLARIAIVVDPVGAHLGLWQPLRSPT
jgi:uncharacterized protein